MMMTHPNDDMVDDLLAQARGVAPAPSDALVARVLGDAAAVRAEVAATAPAARPSLWTRAMDAIGGWPSLSGLAAATVAGVWIGAAPPATVSDLTAGLVGDEVSVSLFSEDILLAAGGLDDG